MSPKQNIQIEVETITPSKAAEYLKFNRSNRRLIGNRVEFYAKQMEKGQWKLTGDSIKFNSQGYLVDGQHRLQAVVKSGVTIQCLVIRNLDKDIFDVLDTGRGRQAGDVLSAYGYGNVFLLASAGRFIYHFEHRIVPSNPTLPNHDILETVNRHRDLTVFCSDIVIHKFARSGVLVACLYWVAQCDRTKGEVFVESFLTGQELKVTNPIYSLRERIINDRNLIASKRNRVIVSAMIFRTFNNWIGGKTASRMAAISPGIDDFPWPAGGPYLTEE